jgi:hypothetical protein
MPDSQTELRASLIYASYLAHQGVELAGVFLEARFRGAGRHRRRVARVAELEARESGS